MQTSELEREKRLIADEIMAENPGVSRLEAKRMATPWAQRRIARRRFNEQMTEVMRNIRKAVGTLVMHHDD